MKHSKSLLIIIFSVFCIFITNQFAQVNSAWVVQYNGPGNYYDYARALAIDGQGNVYVTGESFGSGTYYDYATIKYNSNGVEQWVARYNGPGNNDDLPSAIAVDNSGNVYVTGRSYGLGAYYDYATVKYNSNGVEQWVKRYNESTSHSAGATALEVDNTGNIYVTGTGYFNLWPEFITVKYNTNGDQQWIARFDDSLYSGNANTMTVDNSGNVYVAGYIYTSGGFRDYATIKYNSNGIQQWVVFYNGPGNAEDIVTAIAVDDLGNVYITGSSVGSGSSYDYATIKYNSNGVEQWVVRFNGPANNNDRAFAITTDNLGNVYVTGYSYGIGTSSDYLTIKYNSNGIWQWGVRYNGAGNGTDEAHAIALDNSSNVYVTGNSYINHPGYDYATIKYNSSGTQQWLINYNGPAHESDYATSLAIDGLGNVYVTGYSYGINNYTDYTTIKYVQGGAIEDNEIATELLSQQRNDFVVYPNPARSYFTVRCPQTADRLQIFDVTGKIMKVQEFKSSKEQRVSLDGIKNGIYFVKVNDVMVKEKLIVTR